ncbi:MAG: hypothetical protein PUE18_07580 [Firmicutes bacterium]|nr:hypothetical protein [Bacillota bacterium]
MFGWLANLLIRAPIAGSGCACCEAKKEQLRQMQKAILSGEEGESQSENAVNECGSCQNERGGQGFEMTVSTRYRL